MDQLPSLASFAAPLQMPGSSGPRFVPVTERVCAICHFVPGDMIHPSQMPSVLACLRAESWLIEAAGHGR